MLLLYALERRQCVFVSTKVVLRKLLITYIFNLSLRADLSQPQEGPLDARRKNK